jgi:hypothetical protein
MTANAVLPVVAQGAMTARRFAPEDAGVAIGRAPLGHLGCSVLGLRPGEVVIFDRSWVQPRSGRAGDGPGAATNDPFPRFTTALRPTIETQPRTRMEHETDGLSHRVGHERGGG